MTERIANQAADLYLDLIKRVLTRLAIPEEVRPFVLRAAPGKSEGLRRALQIVANHGLAVYQPVPIDPEARVIGRDHPAHAETMVGIKRLENVEQCIRRIIADDIPGDLIEAGVWRGGTTIFMRAALKALGDVSRTVWVADSFEGLPQGDAERYPLDANSHFWKLSSYLGVSRSQVEDNFRRYGLLDDQVRFIEGWFADTLSVAPIEKLSLLRLDGDMYGSTMDTLRPLYPKLSIGGYVIVDDYSIPACRAAVEDYRAEMGITEPIETIDWTGIYWRRER